MSLVEAVAIVIAGMAAGTINTIVGSGTLITFPTLLFFGVPPVTANVSNSIGLVAGGLTGIHGYRREIAGSGRALGRLVPMSFVGALAGALLLLVLPAEAFRAIVPALIALGLLLVVLGPRIQAAVQAHHGPGAGDVRDPAWHLPALLAGVFVAGMYGGYFGAAQGVILMGLLGALSSEPLQRLNGWKNVLGTVVNGVAAVTFVIVAPDRIDWAVAGLIAVGAVAGGVIGATVGRRLPSRVLRSVIVAVGLVAITHLVWFA